MSNIKKFPNSSKSRVLDKNSAKNSGEVVNIDKKINDAIQVKLSSFVKEIHETKTKQKKLEAYQNACRKLGAGKKKKGKANSGKKPKK